MESGGEEEVTTDTQTNTPPAWAVQAASEILDIPYGVRMVTADNLDIVARIIAEAAPMGEVIGVLENIVGCYNPTRCEGCHAISANLLANLKGTTDAK